MTFDAVPPGHAPTMITPMASSSSRRNAFASPNASSGITMNCAASPHATARFMRSTRTKSSGSSVAPMPNMTSPSSGVM